MIKLIKPHESLDFLKPYLPANPLIVEAGAFTGSDSIKFANFWPQSSIYAFEPVPELFALLREKTKPYHNITCYELGLGNHTGTAQLYLAEKPAKNRATQASSLLQPKQLPKHSSITFETVITIPITTLDAWAQEHHINHIDLLWLDLQGIELDVLKASPTILKKTKSIHIEVATIERYHGQPLYPEVKTWLEDHGFVEVARDFLLDARPFGNSVFISSSCL